MAERHKVTKYICSAFCPKLHFRGKLGAELGYKVTSQGHSGLVGLEEILRY